MRRNYSRLNEKAPLRGPFLSKVQLKILLVMNIKLHSCGVCHVTVVIPAPGVIMMFVIVSMFYAACGEGADGEYEKESSPYFLCMFFHVRDFIPYTISKN